MFFRQFNSQSFLNREMILSAVLFFIVSLTTFPLHAAMDPRFEIDTHSLGTSTPSKPKVSSHNSKRSSRLRVKKSSSSNSKGYIYVVKSGDNLFKILMRDYGLTNDEAEFFIEEIRRENNIYDIRRLKVGQKISIPPVRRRVDGEMIGVTSGEPSDLVSGSTGQSFRLDPPIRQISDKDAHTRLRQVWDKILPPSSGDTKPISINSPTFSLTLDSLNYPVYLTNDNGRMVVDANATIPPLVKALVTEKDPTVRFVSGSPGDGKPFLTALLASAGFYSVEENFNLVFGTDPTLVVHSDFKIEKTSDSIIKQDVVLMNAGHVAFSPVIGNFLKKEGFTVHEPFTTLQPVVPAVTRPLYQISSKKPLGIFDSLLTSLSIGSEADCRLDIFSAGNNGISLSVVAERYFERNGLKTLVTRFDGDPVSYTLFRILETKGYQVIILDAQDNFRNVTDKLLQRINITAAYLKHSLERDSGANYSLQMSGYKLEGAGLPMGGVFVTNLEIDRTIQDILTENGYSVTVR